MITRERNIKIFIGNLPFESTEDDIRALLIGCGQIRYLAVRRDPITNRSKGYGHVEYRTEPECVEAFKRLVGKEIGGRTLKIDFCDDIYRQKYPELIAASLAAITREKTLGPTHTEQRYPPAQPMPPPGVPPMPQHTMMPLQQPMPPPMPLMQPVTPMPPPHPPPQPMYQMPTPVMVPPPVPVQQVMPPPQPVHHQPIPPPPVPEYTEEFKPEYKRPRPEADVLLEDGKVVNKELFYMIKKMTMMDVYNLVKRIDRLMEKSPNTARSILNANGSMRRALVHAKLLLGYKDLKFQNLEKVDISSILDYFIIH